MSNVLNPMRIEVAEATTKCGIRVLIQSLAIWKLFIQYKPESLMLPKNIMLKKCFTKGLN